MESSQKSGLFFSTASLQTICLNRLITFLEHYPPELLSCLPTTLRHRLFIHSPTVDVCRLEKTCAFDGIDSEKLWDEFYEKHWGTFYPGYYDSHKETVVHGGWNHRFNKVYKSDITNREKYFAHMATTIFCAERPSGFFSEHDKFGEYNFVDVPSSAKDRFHFRREHMEYSFAEVPSWAKKSYPTDIVNYLVAADHLQEVKIKRIPNDLEQRSNSESSSDSNATRYYPVPQHDVPKDSGKNGLCPFLYNDLSIKNQRIPPRYVSLVQMGTRLADEDAISLLMDKCDYRPNSVVLHAFEETWWNWKKEDLWQLLSRFFSNLKDVSLYLVSETDYAASSSVVLTACFSNPGITSVSVHYPDESHFHQLNLSSLTRHQLLKKLTIHPCHPISTCSKTWASDFLLCQECLHELKIESIFPEDPVFLSNVTTIIRNPSFHRFVYDGDTISSRSISQLLTTFLSIQCFHSLELTLKCRSVTVDPSDVVEQVELPSFPLAVCDSGIQYKSLKWIHTSDYHDVHPLCTWLLSSPLALNSMHLQIHGASLKGNILQTIASNDAFQVHNLTLMIVHTHSSIVNKEHLEAILKRPSLKSLALDLEWRPASELTVMANALRVQIDIGTLEKLSLILCNVYPRVSFCDIELLLDILFKLPQTSQFSFYFELFSFDLEMIENIYKAWQRNGCKKLKEFCVGYCDRQGQTIPEHIGCLMDEMRLRVTDKLFTTRYYN